MRTPREPLPPSGRALLLSALVLATAGCGARSNLTLPGAADQAAQGGAAGHGQGGSGGSGGGGAPPEPCVLAPAGAPIELVTFSPGNADTPDLAVIQPGSADAPARVLHQVIDADANFWHPELDLVDYTIGPAWPDGVVAGHAPALAGVDAHAWGRIAAEVGSPSRVGLLWYHGDLASPNVTPGIKFRVFDTASWTAGEEVFVDEEGEGAYTLAPGASVGASDEGYVDTGYAAVWRAFVSDSEVAMRVAVLDREGAVRAGPLPVIPPMPYPGRSVDAVWTGETYLVVTSYGDIACPEGGAPPCAPNAVVVSAFGPPGAVQESLELRAAIAATASGSAPYRPRLARYGEHVLAAWSEGALDGSGPRDVYVARLSTTGALLEAPVRIAEGRVLTIPVALAVTEMGAVVSWVEPGNDDGPASSPGFARLLVQQIPLDGSASPGAVEIPVTQATGTLAITAIAIPRAVLVSWAGARAEVDPSPNVTYLARLDCTPAL